VVGSETFGQNEASCLRAGSFVESWRGTWDKLDQVVFDMLQLQEVVGIGMASFERAAIRWWCWDHLV
jgi:hypothetical protein